ncbi:MAG: FHA domain-containing protein [Alphaproteobacteria bacterium]|nr:FHA domain-containing protein [Alphaproteobacteria bacterium]
MPRAFFKIVAGTKQGLNIPLPDDGSFVIGRNSGDLIIEDAMVSGQHARITGKDGEWRLRDLGSTNGTMVDGRLVREVKLRPGAEVAVGNTRMVLFLETDEEAQAAAAGAAAANKNQLEIAWLLDEELVELKGSGETTGTPADVIGQDLRLPPGVNAVVEVVAGQDTGKVFRFTRGNVTIGRRMGEIPLSDPEVSRRHAVIELFGREMIFLRDLGSTNGTFHNGRKVGVARLRSGDTVGVGKSVMKLQVSG